MNKAYVSHVETMKGFWTVGSGKGWRLVKIREASCRAGVEQRPSSYSSICTGSVMSDSKGYTASSLTCRKTMTPSKRSDLVLFKPKALPTDMSGLSPDHSRYV